MTDSTDGDKPLPPCNFPHTGRTLPNIPHLDEKAQKTQRGVFKGTEGFEIRLDKGTWPLLDLREMTFDVEVHDAVGNSTLVRQGRKANWKSGTEEGQLIAFMKGKHRDWSHNKCLEALKYLVRSKRNIICPNSTNIGLEKKQIGAPTAKSAQEVAQTNATNNPITCQKVKDRNLAERLAGLRRFRDANPHADLGGLNAMNLRSPQMFIEYISTQFMPHVYEKVFLEMGVSTRLAELASTRMVQDWPSEYKIEVSKEIIGKHKCAYTGMTERVSERNTAMLQCCDVHCCCVAVLLCCSNTYTRGQELELEYLRFILSRGRANRPVLLWKDGKAITQGQAKRLLRARGVIVFGE
jgi:hypothetical protein